MTYKELGSTTNGSINYYAKIDDDGIIRSSCSEDDLQFQAWLAEGNEPLPAD